MLATVTSIWLVVCGLLGAHHEATTAHAHDGAGRLVHGTKLSERHSGDQPHFHGRSSSRSEAGPCTLCPRCHETALPGMARIAAPLPALAFELAAAPLLAPLRPHRVYRLAPKTSPPVV